MEFEAIDTEKRPEALQDLERFGMPRVPVVVVHDRAVHGWNPEGVAALVGVVYDEKLHLTPEALAQRLETTLQAAQRAIRQVPASQLETKTPGRDRTVRQLGFHIFRVALSFRDAMQQGYLPEEWFDERPPADLSDGAAIAQYGETVRARLADWLQRPDVYQGSVNTYYGAQTTTALFERTVWHTTQHLRQLYALLEGMGVTPDAPLTEADFRGLPLPKEIW